MAKRRLDNPSDSKITKKPKLSRSESISQIKNHLIKNNIDISDFNFEFPTSQLKLLYNLYFYNIQDFDPEILDNIILELIGIYYSINQDQTNCLKYYILAIDNNNQNLINKLAKNYQKNQDPENMLKYYFMGAEKKNLESLNNLIKYYQDLSDFINMEKYSEILIPLITTQNKNKIYNFLNILADHFKYLAKFDKMVKYYEISVDLFDDPEANYNLALYYEYYQNSKKSDKYFFRIIKSNTNPDLFEKSLDKLISRDPYFIGGMDHQISLYLTGINNSKNQDKYTLGLAIFYKNQKYTKSFKFYLNILISKNNIQAINQMVSYYLGKNNISKALTYFKLSNNCPETHYLLGNYYLNKMVRDKMLENYLAAIQGGHMGAARALADYYFRHLDMDNCHKYINIGIQNQDFESYLYYSQIFVIQKNWEDRDKYRDLAANLGYLPAIKIQISSFSNNQQLLNKYLKLAADLDDLDCLRQLAEYSEDTNNFQDMVNYFEKILRINPFLFGDIGIYLNYINTKKYYLEIISNNNLAQNYFDIGNYYKSKFNKKQKKYFGLALDNNPDKTLLLELYQILIGLSSLDSEKINYLKKCVELSDQKSILKLAEFLEKSDPESSIHYYNMAAKQGSSEAYYKLGLYYHKKSDFKNSLKNFIKSYKLGNTNSEKEIVSYYKLNQLIEDLINFYFKFDLLEDLVDYLETNIADINFTPKILEIFRQLDYSKFKLNICQILHGLLNNKINLLDLHFNYRPGSKGFRGARLDFYKNIININKKKIDFLYFKFYLIIL